MRKHSTPFNWGIPIVILNFILTQTTIFGQVAAPIASINGGRYSTPFSVSLTSTTPDAVLRYTLDGSAPDSLLSPQYLNPLTVNKTTTLRVKAFALGQTSSPITTHTYFFNVNHSFPIIALSFKPADFFNDTTGIYTKYTNGLEVPVNVEFFEADGSNVAAFSQLMGVDIQGSASASLPQKSLELKPKKAYGLDNIPYKMFTDLPYTSYKRLILRNNGQDWGVSMFRDDLISSLAAKTNDLTVLLKNPELYVSSSRPAVVYYNGEYWGVYSIKERMKTTFVEQHFGLKGADYDMLENETEKLNGDSLTWDSFYKEINSGINYADNGEFEKLKTKINVQNFLDYNAFYVYVDNEDWPANNVRRFRPRKADGKWNWISYDFDFSMGLFQVTGGFNTGDATPNSLKRLMDPSVQYFNNAPWSTVLFRKCMENANFRRDYINRTADMMNTILKADRINNRVDEYKTLYAPEVPNHTKRWGSPQPSLWIDNLNKIKSFANNRKVNIIKHFDNQFTEVTGTADVTLNVSPAGAGSIQFSTINVSINGWTGTYFKGIDIPVKAIPAAGYVFSRWEGKTLPSTDSVAVNLTENTTLTAIFIPAPTDVCATDAEKPVFQNCPTAITLTTSATCAVATWAIPTATDNCGTPSVTSNFNSGDCFPIGTTAVNYMATDAKNNASICSFNVIVTAESVDPCANDAEKPVFQNCPTTITLTTSSTCAVATWAIPTATDNCGTPTVTSNFNSGDCFPIGTTEVNYTATDAKNNVSICSFNVIVTAESVDPCATDAEKPVFQNCPTAITLTTSSTCAVATWATPTATDNCSTPLISGNFNSGDCFPIGATTVNYTATDAKNNTATCSFNVVVTSIPVDPCATDTEKPVFQSCPTNITLSTSAACAVATWAIPTATDNCGTPSVTSNFNSGDCFPIGTTAVNYTVTDAKNNASICSFNVIVTAESVDPCATDAEKPVFQNCPLNIVQETSNTCGIVNWIAPTATDNCGTPSVSSNFNSGFCFPIGTTTVNYTATDDKNNTSICSFNVVMSALPVDPCATDAIKPVFQNCPSNLALATTSNCVLANWVAPTATDNCGTPSISSNFNSGACLPIGTTTVVYTAIDAKNNAASCSFNVVVTSSLPPCTRVKGSIVREVWTGISGFTVADLTASARYQGTPTRRTVLTQLSVPYQEIETNYGDRIRGFVYPPTTGNYIFYVYGDDEISLFLNRTGSSVDGKAKIAFTTTWTNELQINKQASQKSAVIALEAGKEYYLEVLHKQSGGGDNAGVLWTLPGTSTPVIIRGQYLAQYDVCQPIQVNACENDTQIPVLQNCPTNISLTTTSACAVATWIVPTATDNCGTPSVTSNFLSGACFPMGITTVTYRATDAKNNTSTCSFNVNVISNQVDPCASDAVKPVLQNCPTNISLTTTNACAVATWTAPTATDNCGSPSVTSNFLSGACFPVGNTTVTYTATDAKNNTSNCSFNVTVTSNQVDPCANDAVKPVLQYCPTNISLTTTSACAVATWIAPTATDNCGIPSVTSNFLSGVCFPVGNTTVTYTATDAKNNTSNCSFNVTVQNPVSNIINDIALGITASAPVYKKYSYLTFTVTATNNSSTPMTNVKVEFPYPTGTVNGGPTTTTLGTWASYCAGGILCYTWTIPNIPANTTATLNVPLFVLNNSTTITATTKLLASTPFDSNSGNNQASVSVAPQLLPAQNLSINRRLPTQLVPIVIQSLSPNPTDGGLDIDLESLVQKQVAFYFSNTLGKVVKVEYRDIEKGTNNVHFNVEEFQGGVYFVVPETNIGNNVPTKFVKM